LTDAPIVLTEGALIERLRRDPAVRLDPHVLHAGFIYREAGRAALTDLYRQYLDIGRAAGLPILIGTPTWRANPERLEAAGLTGRDVNGDGVRFLAGIRDACGSHAAQVVIGGLLGCRGDAYRSDEGLSTEAAARFHRPQIEALARAGADVLHAATLPHLGEALGIARAMAAAETPYLLSFVLRPDGTLLDGTPLHEAIARIDAEISPPPVCYLANCVHPRVFASAMAAASAVSPGVARRLIGLQANSSARSPEELDGRAELDGDTPEALAAAMCDLHRRFGTRILGGCCGTDQRHIARIAARIAEAREEKHD
jgi:homocysteine S-methyltransferase